MLTSVEQTKYMNDCEKIGMNGNCNNQCPVFLNHKCTEHLEVLLNSKQDDNDHGQGELEDQLWVIK